MADPTASAGVANSQPDQQINGLDSIGNTSNKPVEKPAGQAATSGKEDIDKSVVDRTEGDPAAAAAAAATSAPPSSAQGDGMEPTADSTGAVGAAEGANQGAADTATAGSNLSGPSQGDTKAEVDNTSSTPASTKADANPPAEIPKETDIAMADAATDSAPAAVAAPEASKPTETPAAADATVNDVKNADGKKNAVDDETGAAAADTRADDSAATAETKADAPAAKEDDEKEDKNGDESAAADAAAASTPAKPSKSSSSSAARRKSTGGPKLNRKGSKARIVHLDAKPGDHYFVKLKGYPAWPVVICDEDMLPQTLIKTRPVTAARQDGTYREDYADGGKRAADRTFPVMYLYTNEFGWVPNQDLHDLDPEKVLDAVNDKMRKDLQKAHQLASENHPLSYYKDLLRQFQEELEQAEEAKRQAAATPKKSTTKKAAKDEDVDMLDVPEDDDEEPTAAQKKSKKRKAEEDARTPQRSDSVKKPKIKITSSGTPKSGSASNGTPSASKSAKSSDAKSKSKPKGEAKAAKEASAPAEPELTPEEKRRRKAKEVLFLRHKIQKGLLTRDQTPKEEEMKLVSDYLTKLEGFPDLEVGVIRETKINKVLKAILKIDTIPREEEFKFKPRSQALLEQWNKLLAAEPASEKESAPANGTSTNGNADAKEETKSNGVKKDEEKSSDDTKAKADSEPVEEGDKPKEEPAAVEAAA